MESIAVRRLQQEFREINDSDDTNFSVGLNRDNWFDWNVSFSGPPDTLYEGGYFVANLLFPSDYPNSPPEMIFRTEMWHPNSKRYAVFPDGHVCISILHAPGVDEFNSLESAEERWRPILGVEAILISVISMLNDPNLDSPANVDAGIQLKRDREGFNRRVRRLTEKSLDSL
jgi:ubiquitin-conjugating enzyme E2 G1